MTQETKHTPTPWHAISQGTAHFISQASDEEFRFAIAKVFEQTYHPDGPSAAWHEAKANAKHIVRCVNAHDELVAALQSIKDWCFPAPVEMPDDSDARCEWYARRLLIIANASTAALAKLS
jgi:hypothetical protein